MNIALISWDSVRADQLPTYGYSRMTTPTLDEWASDGLVFDDVHVSGVGTPTSFSGIFTGKHAHGVQTNITPDHWKQVNSDRRLLSEAMQDAGYYTGGIHANALMSRYYGWDRGWDEFEDHLWTETPDESEDWWTMTKKVSILPTLRKLGIAGEVINAKNLILGEQAYAPWESLWDSVETFLEEAPEPWFLWVLLVDTHHPWCPPKRYREWPQHGLRRTHAMNYTMRRWPRLTGWRRQSIVNSYDNELRHADAFLSRLESKVDDAAFIVHSDHGDELGEHRDYGHAPAMWDTVTRVPLVMKNVEETGWVEGPHTLLDLGSTVLDLAGSNERLNGRPSLLSNERVDRKYVHVENRTLDGDCLHSAVADDGWKTIYDDGLTAFYRPQDRFEQVDRYFDVPVEHLTELAEFRESRLEVMGLEDDKELRHKDVPDDVAEQLGNLGYLE